MCGIVGYIGGRDWERTLLDGLERLEYRGYDSAGVAVLRADGRVEIVKTKGRIAGLRVKLAERPDAGGGDGTGCAAIGHTRWATHGAPSDVNAHPHRYGAVTLVHNGIIENYAALARRLGEEGASFASETDTEIVAALIDRYYSNPRPADRAEHDCVGDPIASMRRALAETRGSFALGVLFDDRPGTIYAARRDNPLIVGIGRGERFLASDVPAILPYTRDYILMENDELAVVTRDAAVFYSPDGAPVEKTAVTASWDVAAIEHEGFAHFMQKEIYEQPRAFADTIAPRIRDGLPELAAELPAWLLARTERVVLVACGTAMHAGLVGREAIERIARVPAEVKLASEFRSRDPLLSPRDLVVVVSQSGETADSLAALRLAKSRGAPVAAVVNVVGSSIAREADYVLYTRAGPEIAVASTKAYTVQLGVLYLTALALGAAKGVPEDVLRAGVAALRNVPAAMRLVLADTGALERAAAAYRDAHDLFYIGRGLDWALAQEGSLKLKEISYVHSEAYAAGELKHGAISLVTPGVPVVAVATQRGVFGKLAGNLREVRARGADVLLLCPAGTPDADSFCDRLVELPAPPGDDLYAAPAAALPLQLFAYYMAVARGCDVDKPRNLAKSVTVE